MKVLQINSTLNTGSTGRIAEGIGKKVIEAGGQSYIAYGRSANPSLSVPIKIGGKLGQAWHLLSTRLFDTHGLHSTQATKKLIRQVEKIDPDIIHLHNLHGYYLNVRVLFEFFKDYKKPVVWTLHDCWAFTGHCSFFSQVNCDKWQSVCSKCPQKKKYPASLLFDRSQKNFFLKKDLFNSLNNLTIVTVSNWLKNLAKKSFLGSSNDVHTIYNGVDLHAFKKDNLCQNTKQRLGVNGRLMLLSVASPFTERKGLGDLIELSNYLSEDEVIVMVGLTQKQKSKLPNKIIGLTRTESIQELASLYSASDILLSTSYEETFGMTIAEAMACGTPAIVYNRTATPELVSERTGFIVEPKDYTAILAIIEKLKKEGKTQYSHACRERAESLFNKDERFMDYLMLYKNLLEKIKVN